NRSTQEAHAEMKKYALAIPAWRRTDEEKEQFTQDEVDRAKVEYPKVTKSPDPEADARNEDIHRLIQAFRGLADDFNRVGSVTDRFDKIWPKEAVESFQSDAAISKSEAISDLHSKLSENNKELKALDVVVSDIIRSMDLLCSNFDSLIKDYGKKYKIPDILDIIPDRSGILSREVPLIVAGLQPAKEALNLLRHIHEKIVAAEQFFLCSLICSMKKMKERKHTRIIRKTIL
ncbi:hypothetical protein PDO_5177, partial [Rhizobium sp. PDO1-076]|uniref:hypothetical protein n=1 Tax=Rhizobium sp. PDO1-076 TaxID=1125979 RepID=UPI00024E3CB6